MSKIAQKSPYKIQIEKGKSYYWCSCGYSNNQPFCDGSHKESGTELKSVKYLAEEDKEVYFCGCKAAKNNSPLCDGSHNEL